MDFGQRLRQLRKEKGLTQKELANLLGVSASMVGQYETNLRKPKIETLRRFAYALGVCVNDLLPGSPYDFYSDETDGILSKMGEYETFKGDNLQFVRDLDNLARDYYSVLETRTLVPEINKILETPLDSEEFEYIEFNYYMGLLLKRLTPQGKMLALRTVRDIYLNPDYQIK